MDNELIIIGMLFIDVAAIAALSHCGWKAVGFAIITNMILINVFARKEIEFLGLASNVGNIFLCICNIWNDTLLQKTFL